MFVPTHFGEEAREIGFSPSRTIDRAVTSSEEERWSRTIRPTTTSHGPGNDSDANYGSTALTTHAAIRADAVANK